MENYKVLDQTIGQGSFGKVAKVLHIPSGREMVWKVTNYGGMCEKERQQLYNEVKILREIKADYIVRCFDKFVDKENTSIYLVMEFCKGGDLAQLITKCREGEGRQYIGEDFIWRIFTQTVLALYECHRRKNKQVILHRDLKPSNIFLDEKMDAKLGDFGFAKALGRAGSGQDYAQTNLGSPYYMSPEQCNGQEYNEKSDIWSLGVVLYELAALNPPFMATNQLSLALKIKEGNFKRVPSRYSEELQRVVRWMLQVEPQDRPDVEDLLNLPHVSMRLRERALKRNLQHTKRKEEEVTRQEEKLKTKLEMIEAKEKELDERESQVATLEKQVEAIQRELAEKDRQKHSLIRSAASRANFINKSHDGAKPHSMIIHHTRNELVETDDLLDDEQSSAHQHMAALNSQHYLKSSLEPTDTSAPLAQNVNNSCVLKPGKQSSGSKHLVLKSAGSAQNMTPRSQGHDFTEIMGYKNIDISRDVDQSYMLKGSNNTNKKTNSSRNASKNEGDSSMLMKDHHSNASQRALLAHQSYQQMTSPANQSLNQMRRSSREHLGGSTSHSQKPVAASSVQPRAQQSHEFGLLQRKGSLNQLEISSAAAQPLVGMSTNSSAGALAGYYQSGAGTNRQSSDSIRKDAAAASCQPDEPVQMVGRSQYPELYQQRKQQQHVLQTGSSQKTPAGTDSSLLQQRNNSINSSGAINAPSQFQLYGSQDNLQQVVTSDANGQKVTTSRQLKRANSNTSSQDHYYGMANKGGIADPNSTMISNAVNMSVLSHGAGAHSGGPHSGTILNTSTSGLPSRHVYQSTSVNSSKDLSLIQQSLAKNFSKHFQQVSSSNQAHSGLQNSHLRDPSPVQQDGSNLMLLNVQAHHTRNVSNQSRGSSSACQPRAQALHLQQRTLNNSSLLGEPSLITPVNQSNTTQNLTAIGLLTRQQSLQRDGDETIQSHTAQRTSQHHLQHASVVKRSFDSVNESYANLNPCLESQNSNHYTATHQPYMAQQQLQMAMASNHAPCANETRQSPPHAEAESSAAASRHQMQQRRSSGAQPVTQSQTIVSGGMGLPPRTNASWQQNAGGATGGAASTSAPASGKQEKQQPGSGSGEGSDAAPVQQTLTQFKLFEEEASLGQKRQIGGQSYQSEQNLVDAGPNTVNQPPPMSPPQKTAAGASSVTSKIYQSKAGSLNQSAVSAKNSHQSESSNLYQPKFTKKNLEKGASCGSANNQLNSNLMMMQSIQSHLMVQKPITRRMSSHEFQKNGMNVETSHQPTQMQIQTAEAKGGYYMKNASMIQALAQKQQATPLSGGGSGFQPGVGAAGMNSSITHQQFIKQSEGSSSTPSAAQQSKHLQHTGTMLTTKAKQSNMQHASSGQATSSQQFMQQPGQSTTQIKGVCKESLETLMRTAAKIQQHHTDFINETGNEGQQFQLHHGSTLLHNSLQNNSLLGSQGITTTSAAPVNQTMVNQSSATVKSTLASKNYPSSAQKQSARGAMIGGSSAENSHRRMVGSNAAAQNSAALINTAAQQRMLSQRSSAHQKDGNNFNTDGDQ